MECSCFDQFRAAVSRGRCDRWAQHHVPLVTGGQLGNSVRKLYSSADPASTTLSATGRRRLSSPRPASGGRQRAAAGGMASAASVGGRSGGGASTKSERKRPKAKDVKEQGVRRTKKSRRPPREGHRQALPDQLEDPNEYGVRVNMI